MKLLSNFLLLVVFVFTGCATKVELAEYKDISSVNTLDISESDKVYKTPIINIKNIQITSKDYSKYIETKFLSLLNNAKIVKVKNIGFSDYNIEINLDSTSSESSYTRRQWISTGKDKNGRKTGYYSDPYWTYYTYATVSMKIIDNNTNEVFNFTKDGSNSFSVTGYYEQRLKSEAYHTAIGNAIYKVINSIANEIVPKAKIISAKINIDDDEDYIFLINMGYSQGIKSQQKAQVFKTIIEKNLVQGRTINNSIYIGDATISNQVSSNNAWIVMDDEDFNTRVKVGDEVKIIFNN